MKERIVRGGTDYMNKGVEDQKGGEEGKREGGGRRKRVSEIRGET